MRWGSSSSIPEDPASDLVRMSGHCRVLESKWEMSTSRKEGEKKKKKEDNTKSTERKYAKHVKIWKPLLEQFF